MVEAASIAGMNPAAPVPSDHILVIGGGIAGLACARHLFRNGRSCTILEAGDGVGGRVRTDRHAEGFLLDRGFQVFLTAYPEAQRQLDYPSLRLHAFYPGALVHIRGSFHRVADPIRRPGGALPTLFAPIGTLSDKVRIGRLRFSVMRGDPESLYARPDVTTMAALRRRGFSEQVIDSFFRPFFGGALLDPELQTSSRLFEFTYRMFAEGDTTLPEGGMERIPRQMAAGLPEGTVRLRTPASAVSCDGRQVTLASGEVLRPAATVVATDGVTASQLIERNSFPAPAFHAVTNVSFAAPEPPLSDPILILNGDPGSGPVNDMCLPGNVSPFYAPDGQALVSCTILGNPPESDPRLEEQVRRQMERWFGERTVRPWRHLRTLRIPRALPAQPPGTLDSPHKPALFPTGPHGGAPPGLFLCGDHRDTASLNGALLSGRRAAEALLAAADDRPVSQADG